MTASTAPTVPTKAALRQKIKEMEKLEGEFKKKMQEEKEVQSGEFQRKLESNAISYAQAQIVDPALTKEEFDRKAVMARKNFERILHE